jgi:hypothetical protein
VLLNYCGQCVGIPIFKDSQEDFPHDSTLKTDKDPDSINAMTTMELALS